MATEDKISAAADDQINVKDEGFPEHPYPSVVERYFTPGYRISRLTNNDVKCQCC